MEYCGRLRAGICPEAYQIIRGREPEGKQPPFRGAQITVGRSPSVSVPGARSAACNPRQHPEHAPPLSGLAILRPLGKAARVIRLSTGRVWCHPGNLSAWACQTSPWRCRASSTRGRPDAVVSSSRNTKKALWCDSGATIRLYQIPLAGIDPILPGAAITYTHHITRPAACQGVWASLPIMSTM